MNNIKKYSALITTILLSVAIAGPANATTPEVQRPTVDVQNESVISAVSTASLTFDRPVVQTTPAPVAVEPVKVQVQEAPAQTAVKPAATPVASPTTSPSPTTPVAAKAPSAPAVGTAPASGKGAAILSAAMGQLGIQQDCTMLVTNSLRAVGIIFHDWPAGYLSLGTVVPASQAQPGDLVYYANGGSGMAHIAVYAGNGQAVHGGFNGNQTVVFSVNVGSGPVFIRVA